MREKVFKLFDFCNIAGIGLMSLVISSAITPLARKQILFPRQSSTSIIDISFEKKFSYSEQCSVGEPRLNKMAKELPSYQVSQWSYIRETHPSGYINPWEYAGRRNWKPVYNILTGSTNWGKPQFPTEAQKQFIEEAYDLIIICRLAKNEKSASRQ